MDGGNAKRNLSKLGLFYWILYTREVFESSAPKNIKSSVGFTLYMFEGRWGEFGLRVVQLERQNY
jgi:hypothetical protein